MKKELTEIITNEIIAVEALLSALDEQHSCIAKKDVFGMDKCVSNIEECSKNIAAWEMKRRDFANGRSMTELINSEGDAELEENYRKIKSLLQATILQKDSNEMLIKQGLSFTNKMLNIMNPDRSAKTYNAYGKVKR